MKKLLYILQAVGFAAILLLGGCKKFLTIPLPLDRLSGSDAYSTDQTTSSVLNTIYVRIEPLISGKVTPQSSFLGLGYSAGLYTDELQTISNTDPGSKIWYGDQLVGTYGGVYWSNFYPQVYNANTTIEAMRSSTLPFRNQWLGEALFCRALLYYYLVNMYGDVPLATSSDYTVNRTLSRTPKATVYQQIVNDLKEAQGLLVNDYLDYNGDKTTDRARPNRMAATALLARVYLYLGDYANAGAQASVVLGSTTYKLETPAKTFLWTSQENIWGILPPATLSYVVGDTRSYYIDPAASVVTSVFVSLSPLLVNSFDPGDLRLSNWTGSATITYSGSPVTYYYAYKYKTTSASAYTETLTLLRLAEQYLIRAEARARQNNLTGAAEDVNAVRARAGLPVTTAATQADLLAAIAMERYHELFTEQGHRFFDLKRTGAVDAVMATVAPQKGATWSGFMQYWPIPVGETQTNLNLTQTPGYSQ